MQPFVHEELGETEEDKSGIIAVAGIELGSLLLDFLRPVRTEGKHERVKSKGFCHLLEVESFPLMVTEWCH